eukprot:1177828-Amphidinium_carterae.1
MGCCGRFLHAPSDTKTSHPLSSKSKPRRLDTEAQCIMRLPGLRLVLCQMLSIAGTGEYNYATRKDSKKLSLKRQSTVP